MLVGTIMERLNVRQVLNIDVTLRETLHGKGSTVYMVHNSGSTSHSIVSCIGLDMFVQINQILTKFFPLKVRGSGNYDTPCRRIALSCGIKILPVRSLD